VRLVKGSNDLEMYINSELWQDPEVLSMADKVQAYSLPQGSGRRPARVEIKLKDGRVLEGQQKDARGSPALPFAPEVLEAKFRRLAGAVLPEEQVEQMIGTVARLERLSSVSQLVRLLLKA
jgi:hypothetical protein